MARRIAPYVRVTPVIRVDLADFGLPGGPLTLKLEQLQHSGSFKARGAFTNLLLRDIPLPAWWPRPAATKRRGGRLRGRRARHPGPDFRARGVSPAKISRIRGYGADLVVTGAVYAEALAASQAWAAGPRRPPGPRVRPARDGAGRRDHRPGAGAQAPGATTVLAGVGGGGLISGIALACHDQARVVGVEPEGAPTMFAARAAGDPVDAPAGSVAVDSLAPRRIGELPFAIAQRHLHSVLLVSDAAILSAQRLLWDRLRIVAEPGGVTALAAVLSGGYAPAPGEHLAVVISGANTTAVNLGD